MNGTSHFGLGVEALALVLLALLVRWAVTGGQPNQHRGPRRRKPADDYVPASHLIPAFAEGWPQPDFRHCIECRGVVPVVVHTGGAYHCDYGHTTIHTATHGGHL